MINTACVSIKTDLMELMGETLPEKSDLGSVSPPLLLLSHSGLWWRRWELLLHLHAGTCRFRSLAVMSGTSEELCRDTLVFTFWRSRLTSFLGTGGRQSWTALAAWCFGPASSHPGDDRCASWPPKGQRDGTENEHAHVWRTHEKDDQSPGKTVTPQSSPEGTQTTNRRLNKALSLLCSYRKKRLWFVTSVKSQILWENLTTGLFKSSPA